MSPIVSTLQALLETQPEALAKIHTGHLGACELQLMPQCGSLSHMNNQSKLLIRNQCRVKSTEGLQKNASKYTYYPFIIF